MKLELLDWLQCPNCKGCFSLNSLVKEGIEIKAGAVFCECGSKYPIINGIPRFVGTDKYVDSFSFEWTKHRTTQLDSANGTTESEERFAKSLDFPLEDLKGKLVLDVGCGTGRFAEIVLKYGGTVVGIDLSFAVDAAYQSMGAHPNMHIIQADIFNLPFTEGTFDFIYSLGVLHHTPDPKKAFLCLPKYLKEGGKISVTLYAAYNKVYVMTSTFWRFFTTKLPKRLLYALAHIAVPLYYLYRIPGLYQIGMSVFPVNMHRNRKWRVLDTFDSYSPTYQSYHTHYEVFQWFEEAGLRNIKVLEGGISLIGEK